MDAIRASEDTDPFATDEIVDAVVDALSTRPREVVRGLAHAVVRRLPVEDRDTETVRRSVEHGLEVLAHCPPGQLQVWISDLGDATAVDVNVADVPLLLSTALEVLEARSLSPRYVLHPVLGIERDARGNLVAVGPARTAEHREAWLHLRLSKRLSEAGAADLREALRESLEEARRVNEDLPAMRARLHAVAAQLRAPDDEELDEAARLVDWLLDDRLVLLGVADESASERLGLLRAEIPAVVGQRPTPVRVGRTLVPSRVHRHERMVDVRVSIGATSVRVVGLFAAQAYADAVADVPVARGTLARILDSEDLVEGSHDERAFRALFSSLPLDVQLGADPGELRRTLVPLLAAQRAQEVTLRFRLAPDARIANVVVTLPRPRFNPEVRGRIQQALIARLGGVDADYHLSVTREDWVLMHFVVHAREGRELEAPGLDEIQREIVALTRTWSDSVRSALEGRRGRQAGAALASRWLDLLPAGFAEQVSADEAVTDVLELDELATSGERMTMRLWPTPDDRWRARLYLVGEGFESSRLIPVLESLGLVVVDEIPYEIEAWGFLYDLRLRPREGFEPSAKFGQAAADTALAVLEGRAEADDLNRLVLLSGLGWEDVAILRAYRRYRRQVGTGFTEAYQNAALCEHPGVAKALIDLFTAMHDPAVEGDPPVEAARATVLDELEVVTRLDQDRILRGYHGLVESTLRTNRYAPRPRPGLALKFDSARVPDAGKPVPHVETFVYAPDLEGIHLRGGPVARGGIRHSDRQEDFRSEVLGLMKAQMTKNALIVPVGAKGGFVIKGSLGADPRGSVAGKYERFVRALLDVTDNIVDGEARAPAGVRAPDGPDPYLVVAPDRGTGSFSDLANDIAIERGYWLGDAFASGGSRGYDHKGMGITARGAWVAVRRHFAELGIDVGRDPVSVVGIGDMSGDVFGNGMLQSRSLRLVAAFDHRDIFLDPDPDPEGSYEERDRLFRTPRSTWQEYDRARISTGGGVWSRTAKSIPLSPEVREVLRVRAEALSPPEVISAILRCPADLLFAGGVGTYVKASDESHHDVSDRANDAVRIDAGDLSVRVVGEGANLGLTQKARINYSRRGGRCNTDAIDNAAGVATSDAEVNLKILLADAARAGRLEAGERDEVLAGAGDEVAERVLADVDAQTRAISREQALSPGGLEAYDELMSELERRERLDRDVEALPASAELDVRSGVAAGLTRPELSVLLAYAKLDLRDALIASELVDDPGLRPLLLDYLPPSLRARFSDLLEGHRLRRELCGTRLANAVIDDMGITWARRAAEEVGASLPHAARAYWVARRVTGADAAWAEVATLGSDVDHAVVQEMDSVVRSLVDSCARAYAREDGGTSTAEEVIRRDTSVAADMRAASSTAEDAARRVPTERWVAAGVPGDLAERVAALTALAALPDVARVSREHARGVDDVVEAFQATASQLPLRRLEAVITGVTPEARWSRWQREGLVDDLRRIRRDAVAAALESHPRTSGADAVRARLAARAEPLERVRALVATLEEREASLDGAAVVVRALRDSLGGQRFSMGT